MLRLVLPTALLGLTLACASDNTIRGLCGTPIAGFDINEVSVLQDAQGYQYMHDAIVLEFDDSEVPDDATWRVGSVDVLVMIPASQFASYADGQRVTVEVWDADNPTGTPWRVEQTFGKADLTWEDSYLASPTEAMERDQKSAWWTFDFADVIPTSGMTSTRYLVGVAWDGSGRPALGYSNFNLSCDRNWTDYGDGFGWILNGFFGSGNTCSWPMFRVKLEELRETPECEGTTVAID